MRIAFVLPESAPDAPAISAVTAEIITRLREGGAQVTSMVPEGHVLDPADVRPRHDLYVLKSKTPMALALGGMLTMAGAGVVNSVRSSALARDKIATTALLAVAGVPVPPSWATGRAACLLPVLEETPLWLKPQRGSRGVGVRRLGGAMDLDDREPSTDRHGLPAPLFAQREVPTGGRDLKVYVVGRKTWAIARPFPARTVQDKLGAPAVLSPAIRAAAVACGDALGLELYGVDFLVAGDRFFVVDVNAFPGYKGVPEAPHRLAEHILERARAAAGSGCLAEKGSER